MILVTGATGHVGNVLVKELVKRGEKVRVMILPNDDLSPIEDLELEIFSGDVRDLKTFDKAVEGCDTVYHLAAVISIGNSKKKFVWDVNVGGVSNLLKLVKKHDVKRTLYMSSVHAFSELETGASIDESVPFDPKKTSGVYGKSKATAALKVLNAVKSGLDVVTVCPSGIIGPYDYKPSEMGKMILDFLRDRLPFGIEGSFDFVDVRDVVQGAIAACEKGKKGETYILSGENITLTEMMKELRKLTGKRGPIRILKKSTALFLAHLTLMNSYITRSKAIFTPYSVHTLLTNYTFNHTKASTELGYTPRPIRETLRDTVNWFVEEYGLEELRAS